MEERDYVTELDNLKKAITESYLTIPDGVNVAVEYGFNRYDCQRCYKFTITLDRDKGVTPMTVPCLKTDGCRGEMMSRFYRVKQQGPHEFEWRKPVGEDYDRLSEAMKEHVDRGGLDLYTLEGKPRFR